MNSFEKTWRDAATKASEQVGQNLTEALFEIATELGGEGFAAQVMQLADEENSAYPSPAALKMLGENYPEAGEELMKRMEQIGDRKRRESELAFRARGRAFLRGMGSILEIGARSRHPKKPQSLTDQ